MRRGGNAEASTGPEREACNGDRSCGNQQGGRDLEPDDNCCDDSAGGLQPMLQRPRKKIRNRRPLSVTSVALLMLASDCRRFSGKFS